MQEIAPNLWHWTSPHPDWRPAKPGSANSWDQDVGCALYLQPARATFFDPLLPVDVERFYRRADKLVAARAVQVLTTIHWHARSRAEVIARYTASSSRARAALAPAVVPFRVLGAEEVIFWLPEIGTLIPGDRLICDCDGRLQVCPQSWLAGLRSKLTVAQLRERLAPLLELPVERILVSHGAPILTNARTALVGAIGPSWAGTPPAQLDSPISTS
jgi:hypothetical protein